MTASEAATSKHIGANNIIPLRMESETNPPIAKPIAKPNRVISNNTKAILGAGFVVPRNVHTKLIAKAKIANK